MRRARNFLCCVSAWDRWKWGKYELGIGLVDLDLNFLYPLHGLSHGN